MGQVGQLPHQYFGVAVNFDVIMTSLSLHSAPPILSSRLLERGKFQKSSSKIYGAHTMVFEAQISNFIEFGPEMAQRNGLKVFGLFCTFPWF